MKKVKMTYEVSVSMDRDQLFMLLKEKIESLTGKKLANIDYEIYDNEVRGVKFNMVHEEVEA
jgi:hypothetical protein